MQKETKQLNTIVKRTKGELLNKQSIVSHSIVKNLVLDAMEAMQNAYTPYSNFKVGAALLTRQHNVYKGCNIENAAYSPSNCAERTAFYKAISEGEKDFIAIAIVGGNLGMITDYCPPCGVCRQVMHEFVDQEKFIIILAKNENDYKIYFLEELLPMGFGPENLR